MSNSAALEQIEEAETKMEGWEKRWTYVYRKRQEGYEVPLT